MSTLIAGFGSLGQAIAQELQKEPQSTRARVIGLRRHPPRLPHQDSHHPNEVIWLQADLGDRSSLRQVTNFDETFETVIYCAAPDERTPEQYRATYFEGVRNLFDAIHARRQPQPAKFVFVSSSAVYDSQIAGWVDETSATTPSGFNGQILLETERWLMSHDPDALVVRLSGIYGPARRQLLHGLEQGTVRMPETRDYWANRIHVIDAARAIIHLVHQHQHGIFIVSDCNPLPVQELYTSLAQFLGVAKPQTGPASPMMSRKRLSNKKLLQTGFEFRWPDSVEGYRSIINDN